MCPDARSEGMKICAASMHIAKRITNPRMNHRFVNMLPVAAQSTWVRGAGSVDENPSGILSLPVSVTNLTQIPEFDRIENTFTM